MIFKVFSNLNCSMIQWLQMAYAAGENYSMNGAEDILTTAAIKKPEMYHQQ